MSDLTQAPETPQTTTAAPDAPAAAPEAPAKAAFPSSLSREDFAKAIAARVAQREAESAPKPAAPAAPAAAAPETAPAPAAAPAAAPEPKFEGFVAELRKIEAERDAVRSELVTHKTKAETLAAWEAALAADPVKFLLDRGMTHEKMQDFLINGAPKVDPAVAEAVRKADEAAAKLAQFEQAQAEREAEKSVAAFKASQVAPALKAETHPLLHAVHGDQLVEVVYGLMNSEYQQGRNLSAEQAAAQLEGALSGLYERLVAVKVPAPAATPAAAPAPRKVPAKALGNGSAGTEAEPYKIPSAEDREARALEIVRRRLAQ